MIKEETRLKNNQRAKEHYLKHKEEKLMYQKEYRLAHSDQIHKKMKLFYKKYKIKMLYKQILDRCNNSNNSRYNRYGGRGIKCFITEEELKYLWFRDKASEMKQPSIDRINNDGNYCLENCRFIEMAENSAKDKVKPVKQYSLSGKLLNSFNSVKEAEKSTGIDNRQICRVALGQRKSCHGFIWKY